MRLGELFAECNAHIFQIATGAMDQDDGGIGAGGVALKAKLGDVQPHTLHLNELASRRMDGFKMRYAQSCRRCEDAKDQGDCDEIDQHLLSDGGHDFARTTN